VVQPLRAKIFTVPAASCAKVANAACAGHHVCQGFREIAVHSDVSALAIAPAGQHAVVLAPLRGVNISGIFREEGVRSDRKLSGATDKKAQKPDFPPAFDAALHFRLS